MEEKILQTKKNGMVMLLLTLLGYVVFTALFVYSLILLDTSLFPGILLMALSILYWVAGIFLFCGLKAVSYTHLDVYKRQATCWPTCRRSTQPLPPQRRTRPYEDPRKPFGQHAAGRCALPEPCLLYTSRCV